MKSSGYNIRFILIATIAMISVVALIVLNRRDIEEYDDNKLRLIVDHPFIFLLVSVTFLSFLIILFIKLYIDGKKLLSANQELNVLNHSFVQATDLARLAHWRYNCATHEFIFSENFKSLLGLNSEFKKPSIRLFMSLVHPEDKKLAWESFTSTIRYGKPFILVYRLAAHGHPVQHIKTIGDFIVESEGQKFLVGVSMDVTEITNKNRQLESKNKKLEEFNSDLASFNYVVSHDLQAPLRKIQMFISRIRESDYEHLTPNGRDYFNRIHASASAMQVLINDLLMFSRTNAGNKKFESSDLNEILSNAIEELKDQIENTKVVINISPLPVIKGIPYQIQQLFVHLLNNAIKFSSADRNPIISIASELVVIENKDEEDSQHDEFYKIEFKDNGIGFEQKYSSKIFNLLFRLHDRSQFPGNGVGLTICKKIIENHHGFIQAQSEPGNGATFLLYFPSENTHQLPVNQRA